MKLALADHLQLPLDVVTQKLAIVAESGAGKTYTAGVLAELMLGAGAQVVVLEPVGVWWGLQANADGVEQARGARAASQAELVALWGQKLDRGARLMFDHVLEASAPVDNEGLAAAGKVVPGGSSHRTYRGQLTGAGLIERHGGGFVPGHALAMGES